MAQECNKVLPDLYNLAGVPTWGRVWQADTAEMPLGAEWPILVERFHNAALVGSVAPELSGPTVGGGWYSLQDGGGQRSTVVIFGSITCPPFVAALSTTEPAVLEMAHRFGGSGIEFVCVYTREAHPGSRIGPHADLTEKQLRAEQLVSEEGIDFPVVVDDLEGSIHSRFCDVGFNNPVFLVDRMGRVTYKSAWLDTIELQTAIESQVVWQSQLNEGLVLKKTYSERIHLIEEGSAGASRLAVQAVLEKAGSSFQVPGSPAATEGR